MSDLCSARLYKNVFGKVLVGVLVSVAAKMCIFEGILLNVRARCYREKAGGVVWSGEERVAWAVTPAFMRLVKPLDSFLVAFMVGWGGGTEFEWER